MLYDGLHSLNFTDHGQSRENLLALNRRVGGAYPLVRNGPQMVHALAEDGFRPIYRQTNDDPQSNPLARAADDFVKELVGNAPDAALYHLTNEIEDPAVHSWTKDALDYANSIKGSRAPKLVIYNHATNKDRALWNACRANIELAVSTGHAIGVHLYDDLTHLDGAYEWLDIKRAVGGLWIFTEIAYIRSIFDAFKGWRNFFPAPEYATLIEKHSLVSAVHTMPTIWFCPEPWPLDNAGKENGFAFGDNEVIVGKLAALNATYKITAPAPVPAPPAPPPVTGNLTDWKDAKLTPNDAQKGANMRSRPDTGAGVPYAFPGGRTYDVGYDPTQDTPDKGNAALTWKRVSYGAFRGWVRSDAATVMLANAEPEPEPTPEPTPVPDPIPLPETNDDLKRTLLREYKAMELAADELRRSSKAIATLLAGVWGVDVDAASAEAAEAVKAPEGA